MLITFDKIREIYFKERESQKLQELPANFFSDAAEYFKSDDETVKSSISDLLDNRQKKIANMALMHTKSETPVKLVNMTKEEELLFRDITEKLKNFRLSIFNSEMPKAENKKVSEESDETLSVAEKPTSMESDKKVAEEKNGFAIVKESIPTFMGPDMKTYCLKKGDKAYIPKELMDFLVQKGICERLN